MKVITLCGSTRFKDIFFAAADDFTRQGYIVLMPMVFHHTDDPDMTTEQKIELDNLHRMKIDMSDAIYVINKDGYIGESTYGEIDWAKKHNKEIYFMEDINQKEPTE